jgi:glyoxylase-like metal-dependent hydrolase (beta-lactamase superfamily II)
MFTGDTLFIDGLGRPDLKANADETIAKVKNYFSILYKKLLALVKNTWIVLPAHTSHPVDFDQIPVQITLGDLKKKLPMLKIISRRKFIGNLSSPHSADTPSELSFHCRKKHNRRFQ